MDSKGNKIGLALSGGGYRAAAYHLGTLKALKKLGILDNIDVISSVSGGSIVAAYYLLNKDNFKSFESSFLQKLKIGVLHIAIANVLAVLAAIIAGVYFFGWWTIVLDILVFVFLNYKILPLSLWIEWQYNWLFFKKHTLSDLPDYPVVSINTTDVAKGREFKFSKDKAWGYDYFNWSDRQDAFTGAGFPISKAVMASSCVPFAFSPIRMPKKYRRYNHFKCPLLLDGGLYDNQGTYEMTESSDVEFHAKYIIVSNAGNTELSDKGKWNIPLMLVLTSNILMKRIERMQARYNMFTTDNTDRRIASCNLCYEVSDRLVDGFIRGIVEGHVARELYFYHGLTEDECSKLVVCYHSKDVESKAYVQKLKNKVKASICWDEMKDSMPSEKEINIARKVGTNLTGLSDKKINALVKYAEWMTTIQVRLYLPNLVNKKSEFYSYK